MNRRELLRRMPANANDEAAARDVAVLGWPAIEPVLPDVLRWLRVPESPVADVFVELLASIGEPIAHVVAWRGLHPANPWVRHRLLCDVLPRWSDAAVGSLSDMLTTTATQPDLHDNDVRALELLARRKLADAAWLRDWCRFREEQASRRAARLRAVAQSLAADGGP
jgi:hypothetical protein